ncbi:putative DsbA family dithiol-disulfide isomerase [Nocardioides albertanoniae]|uniref:Putative DsbA family dithiol-disulfide isomerase n=1 Tax=Nocardioides albertanoniae TaxID=1175486 RepID=A0A543ADP2_9ACTN|nr:DsbA family oxidoreductase [Nocardioides albertanoniae]TQL70707.1 putative DsbA family dithiol-disulfide isomerase [Nocardioides albertanoniae]
MKEIPAEKAHLAVEVWADLGCPWCYIGKHRLEEAIGRRPDADRFVVKIRSFELDPTAPRDPESIEGAYIRSHGGGAEGVRAAEGRAQSLAEREGLPFAPDRLHANTFDLHRVLHHAEKSGRGSAFFSLVQDRYFAGELNPFAADALIETAESVGLRASRVREVLLGDDYAEDVRADVQEGLRLGARGVPFTVFDHRLAVSGALTVDGYARALDEAAGSATEPAAT